MNVSRLFVQLVIAMVCAGAGNMLIPRQIPGKIFGLLIIGLAGVWLGEWTTNLLKRQYNLSFGFLEWRIEGVPIVPAVIGSAIVLYIVTTLLRWGRYSN